MSTTPGERLQDPGRIASATPGERVGTTIHTHTLSEEMTSMMKQMKELQSRYDQLMVNMSNEAKPAIPLPLSASVDRNNSLVNGTFNNDKIDSSAGNEPEEVVGAQVEGNANPHTTPALAKVLVPEIRYTTWADFKNIILEDGTEYAMDVLLGPAKFYWQRQVDGRDRKRNAKNPQQAKSEEGTSQLSPAELLKAQNEMPERARVNSKHILAILKELAPEHFGAADLKPTVFVRPYKLFATYEVEIRQFWKDQLRSRVPEANTNPDENSAHQKLNDATEITTQERTEPASDGVDQSRLGNDNAGTKSDARSSQLKDTVTNSLEALRDLGCLISFMDQHISPVIEKYRSTSIRQVRFRDLWHLYKPGNEIVCLQDLYVSKSRTMGFATAEGLKSGDPSLWRVLQVSGGRPVLCSPIDEGKTLSQSSVRAPAVKCNTFKVLCYMLGYDGDKFGPIYHTFEIKSFEGLRNVDRLDLIPSRLYGEVENLRTRLKSQGLKFMTTTAPSHFIYTGPTLMHHPGGMKCTLVRRTQHIDGSVMVDFKEAYRSNNKWVLGLAVPEAMGGSGSEVTEDFPVNYWKDKDQRLLDREAPDIIHDDNDIDEMAMAEFVAKDGFLSSFQNKLSDEDVDGSTFGDAELVLLPDRVVAFDLHSRQYAIIGLDGLEAVEVKAEGWKDLKLPRGHKKMVQAQVETHFREKEMRQQYPGRQGDLVRGKGQGLIILLHGAPGTGKTSTAECVAEFLKRPLYPITCGDLGITAKEVEETLTETFARAEAWDCVLLLDEADVFLAQRTRTDLKRNAIVSVFLRVLEYYKGILFLTTNRVGAFDEAFKSRIHMHLYYPILNKDQTMSIWQMNLDRLIRQRGELMQVDGDGILQYAEAHFEYHKRKNTRWNGRQIHNAFQTAAALAEYEALENSQKLANLDVAHFKTVANASHQFDRYIAETIGGNDADRALNDRDRADNFRWPAFQKDPEMYARETAGGGGSGGTYHYQPRQGAEHDSRTTFSSSTQRQSQFDAAEFEEFQRQKYFRQFPGGVNPAPASPLPKPWPRPEDDIGDEMDGLHRTAKEESEPSWTASRSPGFQPRQDERNLRSSGARNAPRMWDD